MFFHYHCVYCFSDAYYILYTFNQCHTGLNINATKTFTFWGEGGGGGGDDVIEYNFLV